MSGPNSDRIPFCIQSPHLQCELYACGGGAVLRRESQPRSRQSSALTACSSSSPCLSFPFNFCFCLWIREKKLSEDVVFGQGLGRYAFCFSVLVLRVCAHTRERVLCGRKRVSHPQALELQAVVNHAECWEPNPGPQEEEQALFPAQPAPLFRASSLLPVRLRFTLENEQCVVCFSHLPGTIPDSYGITEVSAQRHPMEKTE